MDSPFMGSLKEKINLLSALLGYDSLMNQGAQLLAKAVTEGRKIVVFSSDSWASLGKLAAERVSARLGYPSHERCFFSNSQLEERDVLIVLCSSCPDETLVALGRKAQELGVVSLLICPEEGLLGGMVDWKLILPCLDEARVAEACLWLVDSLAVTAAQIVENNG